MKLIVPLHGTVGVRVSADDVVPRQGAVMRDVVESVSASYQFAVKPIIPPGVAPFSIPNFVFQSGVLISGDDKWPIIQLAMIPNGDVVTAATTEIADMIVNDFMARMDATFGYRFGASDKIRVYQSNIVVDFEEQFDEKIAAFQKIKNILNGASIRSAPFEVKRLSFGFGDVPQLQSISTTEEIENSDFLIERRSGEPYSRNRYFCSAPMKTSDHVKLLQEIEKELG
jgi:hypothetical protein